MTDVSHGDGNEAGFIMGVGVGVRAVLIHDDDKGVVVGVVVALRLCNLAGYNFM